LRCSGGGSNDYVYMIIPPDNPEMFEAMTEVIGRPDLRTDKRFATPPERARNGCRYFMFRARLPGEDMPSTSLYSPGTSSSRVWS